MFLYWTVWAHFKCCDLVSPTDPIDTGQWTGHFSECPEELTHYCIHGDCRYIREQEAPSCRWEIPPEGHGDWEKCRWEEDKKEKFKARRNRTDERGGSVVLLSVTWNKLKYHPPPPLPSSSARCQRGYIGSRCEYLDLDWRIGEKRQIVIVCIIAGLVLLVLLIVFMCFCSQ